jgi:hypothetical protein
MTSAQVSLPSQIDTYDSFLRLGETVSKEAGVYETLHGYFAQHTERLWKCCEHFDLLSRDLGDVLELGPFF